VPGTRSWSYWLLSYQERRRVFETAEWLLAAAKAAAERQPGAAEVGVEIDADPLPGLALLPSLASFLVREGYLKEVAGADTPKGRGRYVATEQGQGLCDAPPQAGHDPLADVVQRWFRERSASP
jgi:hypothetical protein